MIRRTRRDGREARVNEEREKREDEKGSHCFFKSSGYDKLKCHGVKQNAEICAIGEQKVII